MSHNSLKGYKEVIREEEKFLKQRRQKLRGNKAANELEENSFGIAMSGGGIRSATINMGFLKTLNKLNIIEQADYVSTVSGGGYTGAYLQATLKENTCYDDLFQDEHIGYMRARGEYLLPGSGWTKKWNTLLLTVGYLSSLLMSWISPAILLGIAIVVYSLIANLLDFDRLVSVRDFFSDITLLQYGFILIGGVFLLHFLANIVMNFGVGISKKFNHLEAALSMGALGWFLLFMLTGLRETNPIGFENIYYYVFLGIIIFLVGFFTNPNALSFHRFWRNQLTETYLNFAGQNHNIQLKDLARMGSNNEKDYIAPYPLINTCLNLQAINDAKFEGTKTNDYFLLSPLYCGAKLTGYVPTKDTSGYKDLTLPAATTISAAAVNPGMGRYSNKFLSVIMTMMNARLGFWINNPLKLNNKLPVWWPQYFYYELFSKIGTNNKMLNISDGGHIENLAVYELLRRQCKLIIAVDAGADPDFSFSDLENLTIRARNELGLAIIFRKGETPEEVIRPRPSHGYSRKRFAVADVYQIWEEIELVDDYGNCIKDEDDQSIEALINYRYKDEEEPIEVAIEIKGKVSSYMKERMVTIAQAYVERKFSSNKIKGLDALKISTLVYVKSSVTAPMGKPKISRSENLKYGTYKYKIYHPSFPHESTSDQFFDRVQWEAYYQLGQHIAADVLGLKNFDAYDDEQYVGQRMTIDELLWHFNPVKVEAPPAVEQIIPVPTAAPEVVLMREVMAASEERATASEEVEVGNPENFTPKGGKIQQGSYDMANQTIQPCEPDLKPQAKIVEDDVGYTI